LLGTGFDRVIFWTARSTGAWLDAGTENRRLAKIAAVIPRRECHRDNLGPLPVDLG
jgi:hypothetical protein